MGGTHCVTNDPHTATSAEQLGTRKPVDPNQSRHRSSTQRWQLGTSALHVSPSLQKVRFRGFKTQKPSDFSCQKDLSNQQNQRECKGLIPLQHKG